MQRSSPALALIILAAAAGLVGGNPALDAASTDEQVVKEAGVSTDGPALLAYLRDQVAVAGQPEKIREKIQQLGDDDFAVRERALAELTGLGRLALPLLNRATSNRDPEIAHRAKVAIEHIEHGTTAALPAAVLRLVAKRKPAGAAEVLLAYVPHVENDAIGAEARAALAAVVLRDGKPDPAVKAALRDKLPAKRAAAGEALCRAGTAERPAVRELLKDADASVRLRVALALAHAKEKEAVPVLIDLLAQLPSEQAWQIDDVLLPLAGEQAPAAVPGRTEAERRKYRDAWAAWWQANGAKLDLAKLDQPHVLGYTLVVLLDRGLVMELDKNNKPRWQFEGVQFPLDVQWLPGDHVLLAEQEGGRVTERDVKGQVLWEKKIDQPLMAQRLRNGNTFIANRNLLVEVDRNGKEVATQFLPGGTLVMRAVKLDNGDVACVTMANRFVRMNAAGKILHSFPVSVRTSGGRIHVLRNGNVLIPEMDDNRVVEYDQDGKIVWQAQVTAPIAAVRLANGNTLITSMQERRAVEVDRLGKEVWSYRSDTRVTRALRR